MKQMTLDVVSKGIQFLSILSFNKITIQWMSNMHIYEKTNNRRFILCVYLFRYI
jgi:hypothetical protein